MLKVIENDVLRDGQKVGWLESNHVFGRDGRRLGYWSSNDVYDASGHKLAFIEGNYLHFERGSNAKIPLERINGSIESPALSELGRCAVYVLIGV